MTATARGKLLYKLAELVARDASIIAELETRDTGKVIRETKAVTGYVAEYYRYFAGLADKIEGATFPIDKPDLEVSTRREPLGVVAAIVPWNSQMFLTATKLGPALAAGNTVVIKASEDGPAPLLHFAKLVHEAGFPAGVVNIITGFGADCGQVLTSHPLVARVAFTGGVETARHVVRNTAENFAVTTLELGGKSPVIVFDDANLDSALNGVIAGIWGATGQSCVAGSRLLVHESIHDEFVARLAKRAGEIKIGAPLDMATEMGPLATLKQVQRAEKLIEASVAAGAVLVTGGKAKKGAGYYFEPTILLAPIRRTALRARGIFWPGAFRPQVQNRSGSGGPGQWHGLCLCGRHFHAESWAGAPTDEENQGRGGVGEYLSCGFAHCAFWGQWLHGPWARKRPGFHPGLHAHESNLDQYIGGADG